MKWFVLLPLFFILCSCTNGYENHEAIDAVNAQIDALEQSLPQTCKTAAINAQIVALKKETASIEKDCSATVDKANSERVKWKTAFFGLLLIIGVWIASKLKI